MTEDRESGCQELQLRESQGAPTYIVLDIETTGLNPINDEILQLAIVDSQGAVLFNKYFRPFRHVVWDEAQRVHGISPARVKDKGSFAQSRNQVQQIVDAYDTVVAYNADFDISFLQRQGIHFNNKEVCCAMQMFAPVFGKRRSDGRDYIWQSLRTCAQFFGLSYTKEHDALSDALITQKCYDCLVRMGD